jgi:ABC-type transport system involved in multi-copper enzyme maturation permease subunit
VFSEILWFEIKYHLRERVFFYSALVFFIIGFALMSTDAGVALSDAPNTVNRDAPIVIVRMLTFLSLLGLFVVTAFVASSVLRDFQQGTHMFYFSRPVRKFDYLIGRLSGSMLIVMLLMLVVSLGMIAGRFVPWQDPERVGNFALGPYAYGLLVMALPNLVMMGGVFFAVAAWSRRLLVSYICVVVFLVLQDYAEIMVLRLDNTVLASVLEPAGVVAIDTATRYWTISEYSAALPELAGALIYNRLLWVGIGMLALAWSYARFNYSYALRRRVPKVGREPARAVEVAARPRSAAAHAARSFSTRSRLLQLAHHTRLETSAIMKSTPFIVLLVLGIMVVVTTAYVIGEVRGTPTYPVTRLMLRSVVIGISLFLTITVIFYTGEVVRRERLLGLDGINDALPVPDWVYLGSKLLALLAVTVTFVGFGIISTICVQVIRGFFDFEIDLYARGLLLATTYFALFSVLAVFSQVISKTRFSGYLLAIGAFLVTTIGLNKLGLEHQLLRYGGAVDVRYSDMNGYGHLLPRFLWVKTYWAFAAMILVVLSALFWRRGIDASTRIRLTVAGQRLTRRMRLVLGLVLIGFISSGGFIYYNTNILNEYLPERRLDTLQAEYEKRYRRYMDVAQPRITDVYADVDIYPDERLVKIRGRYHLKNKTTVSIDSLHVTLDPEVTINTLEPDGYREVKSDPNLGYYIYELAYPIAPGSGIDLVFDLTVAERGFVNNAPNTHLVGNGTFFSNRHYFPGLGYDSSEELVDRRKRRKHGLPPVPRMAAVDDTFARRNTYLCSDADWVNFETVVSTTPDQIAIAPGYLEREWEDGGRRHFHYKMDMPMLNFYSYLSADYAVRHDRWNDVAIAIYYHEPHGYNIDRMISAIKKSLDYFTTNFGPYQHRLVRIVEFPCYEAFAQSFPTTIPFSEGAGFVFRIDDSEDIDHVFNTTAHEVAHQWWAHQVMGGNVQGATLMSEALAEYSALMVMEKEYGPDKLRHMLKYELDGYLRGRGREVVEEMPLMLVEDQMYIHYNKGCMVMYALKDYIGEERVNHALAQYVADVGFQEPPYTNSIEFLRYLRDVTPDSLAYLIEDMFETITLFSNRVKSATYVPLSDGRYLVRLEAEARKLRADGLGVETEIALGDLIDFGVFGEDKRRGRKEQTVLFMEKRMVTDSNITLEIVVDALPVRAGIDPYNRLIDRDSDDNVRRVSEAREPS